ncbi:MAG: winged helix-turn-helix transcriptional regulator [Betaproteobacteria bacterium]|nr:winged helix-turn-helix transcriptional regulator [Betaproteobacteria bacterium]
MKKQIDAAVEAVQRGYPQIYLACHADHVKAKSTEFRLSARDSSILSHLDADRPQIAGVLAAHMGVRPSTFSAAINRLIALGYVIRRANPADRRETQLTLSPRGAKAMAATSVLDAARVAAMLKELDADERARAIAGLQLLAEAAKRVQIRQSAKGAKATKGKKK